MNDTLEPQTIKIGIANKRAPVEVAADTTEEPKDNSFFDKDPGSNYLFNPVYHRLSEFLGLDKYRREDTHLANKLAFIYEWGQGEVKSENATDILAHFGKIIKTLGVNFRGEELIGTLYQHARLSWDKKRVKAERQGLRAFRNIDEKKLNV